MIVCVVYYPPFFPAALLLTNYIIETAYSLSIRNHAAKLVVCGDFNRLDISEIVLHLNLTQVITFPTYKQATLDLIITDMAKQCESGIVPNKKCRLREKVIKRGASSTRDNGKTGITEKTR